MIFTRSIRDEKGSITIATAVLLSAIVLLNTTLLDYVTFKTQESRIMPGMLLACKSVLASYDSLLAEKYGLFGLNTGSGGSAQDLFERYYHADESHVTLSGNFTESEILKEQICDLMKLRTPLTLTETVLEACGILSEAAEEGKKYKICGEASELLTEMQKKQKDLKMKVEGYFQGDPTCVNGYSKAAATDIIQKMIKSQNNEVAVFLDQAIVLCEQYQEYNLQAALLCRELEEQWRQIEEKLRQAENGGSSPQEVAIIRQQALQMRSGAIIEKIVENISVFSDRLSVLKTIKNSGILDRAAIENAFLTRKINTDIQINVIYAGNSGNTPNDERAALKEELQKFARILDSNGDAFVIPSEEYAALPSVRSGIKAGSGVFPELAASDSLDSFDLFSGFFSFGEEITFESILQTTTESFLIDDYILYYMTSRMDGSSEDKINNETEYILNGDASAAQNNKSVEHKIITLRFLINFINIMKDAERSASAEAMARAIAAALSLGAGVLLYKFVIISAWALVDSYLDLERLLSGKAVPMIPFGEIAGGKLEALQDYEFYLRLFLMITPIETKLKRICDIIEINMREWTGMAYRLSGVYHKISASAKVRIELISPFLLNYGRKTYYREDFCEISY
jgi:hypothetical protein